MTRTMLASLGAGVAQNTTGSVAAGRAGTIYLSGTGTPVTLYAGETGGSTYSTDGTFTTDALGRIPGWVELGLEVDITVPPADTVTVITQGAAGAPGPPGFTATWKGLWAVGTTYTAGPPPDGVIGSNGHWYVSLTSGNIGHDPTTDGGVHWADTTAPLPANVVTTRTGSTSATTPEIWLKPSGGDDTSEIQAAIDDLPQTSSRHGGVIVLDGDFACSGHLDLNSLIGIQFRGPGYEGGYGDVMGSSLVFSGLGSGPNNCHIDARSSVGFVMRGLSTRYSNPSYAGYMIDLSHGTSGADAGGFLFDGCQFGGDYTAQVYGAAALLNLDLAIIGSIQNSAFQFAQIAISGNRSGYSNSINIHNCGFDNTPFAALLGATESWTVEACTFEGTNGLGPSPFTATLSGSGLSTGGAITSLPVTALSAPVPAGAYVTIWDNDVNTQTWQVTAPALAGATSLAVASQTPNFAYPNTSFVWVCGGSGMGRAYYGGGEVRWFGNWFGDAVNVSTWIDSSSIAAPDGNGSRHRIMGNFFSQGFKAIDLSGGGNAVVTGNRFGSNNAPLVDLGTDDSHFPHIGTVIVGNDWGGGSALPVHGADKHYSLDIRANKSSLFSTARVGGGHYDRFDLSRPIITFGPDTGSPPTIAAKAAAGSGASASLVDGGDHAGRLTLITGTGPATGEVLRVTLGLPLPTKYGKPQVVLTPENAAASAAQVFASYNAAVAEGDWSINAGGTALAAGTTYEWSYWLRQ